GEKEKRRTSRNFLNSSSEIIAPSNAVILLSYERQHENENTGRFDHWIRSSGFVDAVQSARAYGNKVSRSGKTAARHGDCLAGGSRQRRVQSEHRARRPRLSHLD